MDVMYFTIIEFNPSFIELYAVYIKYIVALYSMLVEIGKRMGLFLFAWLLAFVVAFCKSI